MQDRGISGKKKVLVTSVWVGWHRGIYVQEKRSSANPLEHTGDPDKRTGPGELQESGSFGYSMGGADIFGDGGGRETSWGGRKREKWGR